MAAATNAADGEVWISHIFSFSVWQTHYSGCLITRREFEPRYSGARQPIRMRNHDRARNADGDAFGSVGEAREQSRSLYDDHTSIVSHRGMRLSGCSFTRLLGEKECGLLCATSPSESSPSLTGHCRLTWPPQYPARHATPNCHLIDSRTSGDNGGFCASTASEVGRVKISILLWRYGRIAGKLVPPRGNGLISARMNDDISLLEGMRT